jgi:hypothetical protein
MANFKQSTISGYIVLPKGTTAQRPSNPVANMIRYNTDLKILEYYTTAWIPFCF